MPFERREYPTFSWSHSRRKMFRECPRKYYYHYYASHNGWGIDAPESARRAYRLKNLTNLPMEIGAAIHEAASDAIRQARSGKSVPTAEYLYAIVRERLNKVWKQSSDSDRSKWERDPKQCRIFHEFYYGSSIDDDKRIEAQDRIKRCLANLLRSVSFREAVASQYIEIKDGDEFTTIRIADTDIYAEPDLVYQKADRTWMIVDWKTGTRHDDDVEQAQVYALYLRERYKVNESDITVRIEYLDSGETQELSFTQEDFENNIAAIHDSISSMMDYLSDVAANAPLEKDEFPLQISYLCRFCEFYELDRDEIAENHSATPDDSRIEELDQEPVVDEEDVDEQSTTDDNAMEQEIENLKRKHDMQLKAEKREVQRQRKMVNAADEKRRAADGKRKEQEDKVKDANETIRKLRDQIAENKRQHRHKEQEVRREAREEAKRDNAETIEQLHEKKANLELQLKNEQDGRRSDKDRLGKQLADVVPAAMSAAWRQIDKGEPLSAYREAVTVLEDALRATLGHPLKPNSNQEMDLYDMIETAFSNGYISRKQLDRLHSMRDERRNLFMHHSEDEISNRDPLGEREARDAVAYLGQVVALLDS